VVARFLQKFYVILRKLKKMTVSIVDTEKSFAEIFENLTKYKSDNNLVGSSK